MQKSIPVHLLYFSDSARLIKPIECLLSEKGYIPSVKRVKTLKELKQEASNGYNAALVEIPAVGKTGFTAVKNLKERKPFLPVILICNQECINNIPKEIEKLISDAVKSDDISRLPFILNREQRISLLYYDRSIYIAKNESLNTELIRIEDNKSEELKILTEKVADTLNKKKIVEQSLAKSESVLKVFHEVAVEGLGILSAQRDKNGQIYDYIIRYVNPSGAMMMQRPIDDIIENTLTKVFSKDVALMIINDFNKVVKTGKSCDIEYRVEYKGDVFWIRNLAVKLEDGIAVTFSDITKRKIIENEKDKLIASEKRAIELAEAVNRQLARSKEEYRLMGETIPFGVWKANADGSPVYASKSFLDLLGAPMDKSVQKEWMFSSLPSHLLPLMKKWASTMKSGDNWEGELALKDKNGKEYHILSKGLPVRNEAGEIESWVGINLDISSRIEMENRLKETTKLLEEILERVNDAFFALDKNWNITYLNTHSKEFNALDKSCIGKNFWEKYPELINTIYFQMYHEAMDKQHPVSFEAYGAYSNNWYLISVYPSEEGITVYAKDISGKKMAEDKLKVALSEKEVLIREVHHRVKNNLQVISSMLSLQANYQHNQALVERFTDTINRIRAMAIVHEQLYKNNKLSSIDFKKYIIDLVYKLFNSSKAPGKMIFLDIECPEINLGVDDSINIGLIINEIMLNSLKHAFKIKDRGSIKLLIQANLNSLLIDISDDGDGISNKEDIENSETFGMQLISSLVKQMGGSLVVNSLNGTQFLLKVKTKKEIEVYGEN
jgi:PAS domain S-box-containing protein